MAMGMDGLDDADVRRILCDTRRIAMVGASDRQDRPSNGVMRFLQSFGWQVTPVNPSLAGKLLLGVPVVASLAEAGPLDMVDIFRAAEHAGEVVDAAIALGARTVWMQLGVIDAWALDRARAAGLNAVMHRCPAIEAPRLRASPFPYLNNLQTRAMSAPRSSAEPPAAGQQGTEQPTTEGDSQ